MNYEYDFSFGNPARQVASAQEALLFENSNAYTA